MDTLTGLPAGASIELEDRLRRFITERELPLYRIMAYQLGWVDENGEPLNRPTPPRLHGQMALAAAQAVGGDYRRALDYGVSVELLHNFSLVHEDVQDGNTERDGRPTVWWAWGPAQAINAGDGMHAMARLSLYGLVQKGEPVERVAAAIRALDESTVELCEGEYLDIAYQERLTVGVESYLAMATARAGSLLGCAARIGTLAALDGADGLATRLSDFGKKVGLAQQVASDHAVLWGDGSASTVETGRLAAKKKILPVVYALESAEPSVKRKLGEMYMQRILNPEKLGEIADLLESAGAREYSASMVEKLAGETDALLEESDLSDDGKQILKAVAAELISNPD